MNTKLILWSFTVALGGFLFGLDTAVISGAEQTIQKLWNLNDTMHGFAISIALYGTVTNLFHRINVLTWARSSATGEPVAIEMRPLAPLVVGLDWRF